ARFPTPLLEPREQPIGDLLVVGGADVMRVRAEKLHEVAHIVGQRDGAELLLPLRFRLRAFRRETRKRRGLLLPGRERTGQEGDGRDGDGSVRLCLQEPEWVSQWPASLQPICL